MTLFIAAQKGNEPGHDNTVLDNQSISPRTRANTIGAKLLRIAGSWPASGLD